MVNSRNPLVSATHTRSKGKPHHGHGHTFSRSYGVNLPSSLASVLSRALGFSPRPPESVCGTVTEDPHYAAFLGSMESPSYGAGAPPHHVSESCSRVCGYRLLREPPTCLNRHYHSPDRPILLRPCLVKRTISGAGILTCFPSPTPFGLGLGAD